MKKQNIKEKCMNEDFDILHKCVESYNHDILNILGIKKWSKNDTKDFLDVNDKLFWTLYSCIIETKIKYGITKFE